MLQVLKNMETEPQENVFVAEYRKAFPHVRLSLYQQEMIESQVTDFEAWQEAIMFWAGNAYRAESIFKVIEYYKQAHSSSGKCSECDNGWIRGNLENWPCEKCNKAAYDRYVRARR